MQDDAFDHQPRTEPATPAPLEPALVGRIIEAALLASPQPMAVPQLSSLLPGDHPNAEASVRAALEQLSAACAWRGVELVEVASGWRAGTLTCFPLRLHRLQSSLTPTRTDP